MEKPYYVGPVWIQVGPVKEADNNTYPQDSTMVNFRMPWPDQFEWDYKKDLIYLIDNCGVKVNWNEKKQCWQTLQKNVNIVFNDGSRSMLYGTAWATDYWDDVPVN